MKTLYTSDDNFTQLRILNEYISEEETFKWLERSSDNQLAYFPLLNKIQANSPYIVENGIAKRLLTKLYYFNLSNIFFLFYSQHLEVDVEGKLSLHQLTNLLESVIEEQNSGLPKAVVNIYKHEVVHLR